MHRTLFGLTLLAFVLLASVPRAHDGHDHKIMGVVSKVDAKQIEVKDREGKLHTIAVDAKTKILHGTAPATIDHVTEGVRVVVNVGNGKAPVTAREIRIGARETTKPKS